MELCYPNVCLPRILCELGLSPTDNALSQRVLHRGLHSARGGLSTLVARLLVVQPALENLILLDTHIAAWYALL